MIRPSIRPIVIAGIAYSIAAKALEDGSELSDEARKLLERLLSAADNLIAQWPSRIRSPKELKEIGRHIDAFTSRTHWDYRPRNIQTYTNFLAMLLEDTREKIKDPVRRKMIDSILEASVELWSYFTIGGKRGWVENEWCLQAGIRAAKLLEGIMENG